MPTPVHTNPTEKPFSSENRMRGFRAGREARVGPSNVGPSNGRPCVWQELGRGLGLHALRPRTRLRGQPRQPARARGRRGVHPHLLGLQVGRGFWLVFACPSVILTTSFSAMMTRFCDFQTVQNGRGIHARPPLRIYTSDVQLPLAQVF